MRIDSPVSRRRVGLIESVLQKVLARTAQVISIEDVGPAFRIITLEGEALRDAAWSPGDKIQIHVGRWVQRTYTPIDWDSSNGRTRFLIYLHADSPGVRWARALRAGDECSVVGPRKSIRLAQPHSHAILFGDETSIGLAVALSNASPQRVQNILEVSSAAATRPVIDSFRLVDSHIAVRLENNGHFGEIESRISSLLQSLTTADIILTGQSTSVQTLNLRCRSHDVASGTRQRKAYWAPGKTGLD